MTSMARHGGTPKVIAGVVLFFGLVYLIYIYNDVSGQLKDTEHTAERYRRESESVAAQLSELTVAKEELKQRCETDKTEFSNRLTALQQQHKMLKSQHEDMQTEYHKLQKEHNNEAEDHKLIDEQRNQEYNQFKQEKILEVSNLKDQVANYERVKVQLTGEIAELKKRLQESFSQIQTDQQTIASLQQQLMNYKNAAAVQQQQNLAAGAQQGGNLLQGAQGNLVQPGAQQGQFMHQLQGIRQDMQQGGAQQGGLLQQNLNQPVFEQQQQAGQQQGGGQNFNIFGQQQFVPGNQLRQSQDVQPTAKKDSKEEAARVMKEQEQHQLKPPSAADVDLHEKEGLGHQKLGQDMIGLKASKDKDIHAEGPEQIGRPNFNINHPLDGRDEDQHEGAAEGALGHHDGRIENQGPVNLQVQEPVIKDHAEPDRPIVDDNANLKFRPIMPEDVQQDVQQQVQPQAHDDTIKKEQIDHPILNHQEIQGNLIDDNPHIEKNLGPLEKEDDDDENYDDDEYDNDNDDDDDNDQ